MLIVGLTGTIGSGKSTVTEKIQNKYGFTVIDADKISKSLVDPGMKVYNKIVENFKDDVPNLINEDKTINRNALGKFVFSNEKSLNKLNSLIHPEIKKKMFWEIFFCFIRFKSLIFLDVPLLFEKKLNKFCSITINVSCENEKQLDRLKKRNPKILFDELNKRIQSQLPNKLRNIIADIIIDNNNSIDDLNNNIDDLMKKLSPNFFQKLLNFLFFYSSCYYYIFLFLINKQLH